MNTIISNTVLKLTNGEHEFEQTPRDSEGQGSRLYCSPWVAKGQT